MFCDREGGLEDPGLEGLQADFWSVVGGAGFVGFFQGEGEFAADGHPFCRFEVCVLEEEEERGGAQEGGVLSVQLRFAEFGRFVGGWLSGWVAGDLGWRRKGVNW